MTRKKLFSIVVAALLLVCIAGVSFADIVISGTEPIYGVREDGSKVELHYLWRTDGWIEEYFINDGNTITVRSAELDQGNDEIGSRSKKYTMSETIEGMPVTSVGGIGVDQDYLPNLSYVFGCFSDKSSKLLYPNFKSPYDAFKTRLLSVTRNSRCTYTEIVLPPAVTKINNGASLGDGGTKNADSQLPISGLQNVTYFGENSYYHKAAPQDLNLKNAKYIGKGAFGGVDVEFLNGINEMGNLEYLGAKAFSSADFTNFIFPNQYFEIEGNPFTECRKLTNIEISPDNQYFMFDGNSLYDKTDKRLLCYLCTNAAPSYEIKSGIKIICAICFLF